MHEKGVAVYEQNAARRAERRAERLAAEAEEESYEEEDPDELDEDFEDDEETGLKAPGWLSGVLSWGHKVTKELEGEAEPEPPQDPNLGYEPPPAPDPADVPPPQPAPEFEPIRSAPRGPVRPLTSTWARTIPR